VAYRADQSRTRRSPLQAHRIVQRHGAARARREIATARRCALRVGRRADGATIVLYVTAVRDGG